MVNSISCKVDDILKLWGRMINERIGTEFPCIAAGMRYAVQPYDGSYIIELPEETCVAIGDQVHRLRCKKDSLRYEIILAKYGKRFADDDICDMLGIGRTKLFKELSRAKSYIEGAIEGAELQVCFYA